MSDMDEVNRRFDSLSELIDDMKAKVVRLEAHNESLMRENKLLTDIITTIARSQPQPTQTFPNMPLDSYGPIAKMCPKCGLTLSGVMSYCCPNAECPTGLGPVMCKAG